MDNKSLFQVHKVVPRIQSKYELQGKLQPVKGSRHPGKPPVIASQKLEY